MKFQLSLKLKTIFFAIVILVSLGLAKSSSAAVYYVSSEGDDANPGTQAQPWLTLSKVNSIASTLVPGDSVFFNRGDTFAGNLYFDSIAGSALGGDITFGAYGTGALPIIDATGQGAGISVISSSRLTFTSLDIRKASSYGMQFIFGNNHITIDGVTAGYNGIDGIIIADYNRTFDGLITNSYITVKNSTVNYNAGDGLALSSLANSLIQSNAMYRNCQSTTCGNNCDYCGGMYMSHSTDTVVEYNVVSYNDNGRTLGIGGAGLWLDVNGSGQTMRYNLVHHNGGPGLYNETTSDSKIYGNVSYDNGTGIWLEGRMGDPPWNYPAVANYLVNNTAYHNRDFGILIQCAGVSGAAHDNVIKNNIAYGTTAGPNLRVGGGAENESNTIDHNSFGPETANMFEIGWGSFRSTYAALDSWYGQATNSANANPIFVNYAGGDLSLMSSSPGINSGFNFGTPYNFALSNTSVWPNSVSLVDRGSTWDIGAYEYIPGGDTTPPAAPSGLSVN